MARSRSNGLRWRGLPLLLLIGPMLAACEEDPTEPTLDVALVTGTYTMTTLRFDPQGSLPDNNLLPALGDPPELTLTPSGQAQIVFRDPATTLIVTIQGTFQTTATGARIDFASQSPFGQLLLLQSMEFTFNEGAGTLAFDVEIGAGVSRGRLVQLVPALANEQLLDPTPGRLRVTFTRE